MEHPLFSDTTVPGVDMPFLIIIVAVVAIVIYSAQHDLYTLAQFSDYVRGDAISVLVWFAAVVVALFLLGVALGVFRRR